MKKQAHLLLVEDNPDHREMLIDALSKYYKITTADSKESCLVLLKNNDYQLVILDYYLKQKFSGLDTLKMILKTHPTMPVVMVTAYGDEDLAVNVLKSGARDYIKKTIDNSFVKRLIINIKEILNNKEEYITEEKQRLLQLFIDNENLFIEKWQNKIIFLKDSIGVGKEISVDTKMLIKMFSAFLADLQNQRTAVTLDVLKKMIWAINVNEKSLVLIELLNISFKQAAREFLSEQSDISTKLNIDFMRRIESLVDENDLELSKEYEKKLEIATKKRIKAERLSIKFLLLRTLQHEIRQPLTYIFNATEILLKDGINDNTKELLVNILNQVKTIDKQLSQLENDNDLPLKKYSDELPIFDITKKKS